MLPLELRLAIAHNDADRSLVPSQSPHKLLSFCVFSPSPQTQIIHLAALVDQVNVEKTTRTVHSTTSC